MAQVMPTRETDSGHQSDMELSMEETFVSDNDVMLSAWLWPIAQPDFANRALPELDQRTHYLPSVNSKSKGLCLIISNEFDENDARRGAEIDCNKLSRLFKALGFRVFVQSNLSATKMKQAVRLLGKKTVGYPVDCLVTFVLTNNVENDVLLGSDDSQLPIQDLVAAMTGEDFKQHLNKPKLLFVNTCQGNGNGPDLNEERRMQLCHITPQSADIFVGYSTSPDHRSYRDNQRGSFYIDSLVKVLASENIHFEHIDELMIRANKLMSELPITTDGTRVKQMSFYASSLRRKFYFRSDLNVPEAHAISDN